MKKQTQALFPLIGVLLLILLLLLIILLLALRENRVETTSPTAGTQKQVTDQLKEGLLPPRAFADPTLLILHPPRIEASAAQAWARARNADPLLIELAPLYWELAPSAGVDPLVAYCQAALETNFLRFGGVLDSSFHNPCGLKTPAGGADTDRTAHTRFSDWQTGIRAQIDHLALYAGQTGYPLAESPDPRAFPYLLGQAPTVEALSGHWAPSPDYGSLLRGLMEEAHAYQIEKEESPS